MSVFEGGMCRDLAMLVAAGLALAFMGGLALTGSPLGGADFQRFEPGGIVAASSPTVKEVEIRFGPDRVAFHRTDAGVWTLDGAGSGQFPEELISRLETGLRFLHVAAPTRALDAEGWRGTDLADFGLDPPAYVVSLRSADDAITVVDFGSLTPAQTSQYVRLLGQSTLFLLPRHVGAEWRLTADIALRIGPIGATDRAAAAGQVGGFLLPASMEQVWGIEIVSAGKLYRFERDNASHWFLHLGQHTHVGGANVHIADPDRARVIAAALEAFGQTQIETLASHRPSSDDLERFGLTRPQLLAFLYPRDSSTPLTSVEIGGATMGGFARYARLAQNTEVVTIADYQRQRLLDLVNAAGAAR